MSRQNFQGFNKSSLLFAVDHLGDSLCTDLKKTKKTHYANNWNMRVCDIDHIN